MVCRLIIQHLGFSSFLSSGVSGSLEQLVVARVLAGISGGGMISLVSIIITGTFLLPDISISLTTCRSDTRR